MQSGTGSNRRSWRSFSPPEEAPLRAYDFNALEWTEQTIWGA